MRYAKPPVREADGQFAIGLPQARDELVLGLSKPQAVLPPKYFYDTQGSKLFEAICALDEYYLTRTEALILRQHGGAIAESTGRGTAFIDLGAGNCAKAASLLGVLHARAYVPVDISAAFLRQAVAPLAQLFPGLQIHPVELDFSEGFTLPPLVQALPQKLFFYPGSSLGNFAPLQAQRLLHNLHALGGELLFGLDLVKDIATLEAAYGDALGVTAAFNLNILRHVNRLLGSDFQLADWAHHVFFNQAHSRIELHLRAQRNCQVTWPGGMRDFAAGEMIHTENCYKFTRDGTIEMFERAGFGQVTCWTDPEEKYLVCHARQC
jgi:dimethylhistidine N-methyltransferase